MKPIIDYGYPQPNAAPRSLVDNLILAFDAAAKLKAMGHAVLELGTVKPGQARPWIQLEPTERLSRLAEAGDEATWYQTGTKNGQRFRVGLLDFPGVMVTWKEILGHCEAKRRAA